MINSNDSETRGESIKIAKEETLRSSVSMNHNKCRRIGFTIKCNSVEKAWLVTGWTEPSNFRARRTRTYINMLLSIPSPKKQRNSSKFIKSVKERKKEFEIELYYLLDNGKKAFLSGDDMIGRSGNPTEWRPEAFRFRRWTDVVLLSNFFRHFSIISLIKCVALNFWLKCYSICFVFNR